MQSPDFMAVVQLFVGWLVCRMVGAWSIGPLVGWLQGCWIWNEPTISDNLQESATGRLWWCCWVCRKSLGEDWEVGAVNILLEGD